MTEFRNNWSVIWEDGQDLALTWHPAWVAAYAQRIGIDFAYVCWEGTRIVCEPNPGENSVATEVVNLGDAKVEMLRFEQLHCCFITKLVCNSSFFKTNFKFQIYHIV